MPDNVTCGIRFHFRGKISFLTMLCYIWWLAEVVLLNAHC